MTEYLESSIDQSPSDSEMFLKTKMDIQREVIQTIVPKDIEDRGGAIMKWIEENSSKFRSVFEKMSQEDPNFFSRCEQDKSAVVEEIVSQLKDM